MANGTPAATTHPKAKARKQDADVAIMRLTVDDEVVELELGNLTLGDMRLLKQHFGIANMSAIEGMLDDPDFIAGIYYLALKRRYPEWEHQRLMNKVDAISLDDLVDSDTESSPKGSGK